VERLVVNSVVAVVGRNGSGKTTLLDAIAGFIEARGRVVACGRDVSRLPPHRRGLAYVQSTPIDPPQRVGAFLRAVARLHGTEGLVDKVASRLGISHLLDRRRGLSTGQKQLVNLAAALLARPCAFLMDELSAHLADGCFARSEATLPTSSPYYIVLYIRFVNFALDLFQYFENSVKRGVSGLNRLGRRA